MSIQNWVVFRDLFSLPFPVSKKTLLFVAYPAFFRKLSINGPDPSYSRHLAVSEYQRTFDCDSTLLHQKGFDTSTEGIQIRRTLSFSLLNSYRSDNALISRIGFATPMTLLILIKLQYDNAHELMYTDDVYVLHVLLNVFFNIFNGDRIRQICGNFLPCFLVFHVFGG